MKLLVTAFDSFNKRTTNVSNLVLNELDSEINDFDIDKLYLPVKFHTAFNIVKDYIEQNNPELIILCGEAISRSKISLEIKAKNHLLTKLSDDDEVNLDSKIIDPNGPKAIYSEFPIIEALSCLFENEIPCELSIDAGGYICNALYYQTQNAYKNIPCLFVHFPNLTNELSINRMIKALELIINSL